MELPPELEAAIRAAPDDREGYLVAADWLQQQGDPQGELVALQLATRSEDIRDREIALEQQLWPRESHSPFTLEWRWGFVRGIHLASLASPLEPRLLRDLLASPIARFVQKLVVQDARSAIVDVVLDADLRCLRTLMMFVDDSAKLDLARLSRFPLRRLVVRAASAAGPLALPELLELSLDRVPQVSRVIAASSLPAIEQLQLGDGWERTDPDSWLDPDRLPRLETVTLASHGGALDVDLWQGARIGAQLEHLDVFDLTRGIETQRTFVIDRRGSPEHAALLVMVGPRRGELLAIARPTFSIGSEKGSHFRLSQWDDRVRHARLHYQLGQWCVRRYDQRALTFVNGHDVAMCPLRSQDELAIRSTVFRFLEGDVEVMANQLRTRFAL